jgi:phage tail-like protein
MSELDYPLQSYNFEVTFKVASLVDEDEDGDDVPLCSGSFSELSGLEASMEPKVIKEGGRNYGVVQRAGPVTFATVILKRGMTSVRDLWKWFDLIARGRYAKRLNVRVTMKDESGSTVLTWLLRRALPIKCKAADLNAQGGHVAIEELHIAHEGFELDTGEPAGAEEPNPREGTGAGGEEFA